MKTAIITIIMFLSVGLCNVKGHRVRHGAETSIIRSQMRTLTLQRAASGSMQRWILLGALSERFMPLIIVLC